MFKPDIPSHQTLMASLAVAQVHATLALAATQSGQPNRTTEHMEKARKYLAEVEEEPIAT